MAEFLGDNFLLNCELAVRLYHDVAAPLPIIDYHCHLPPEELAANAPFDNLTSIWLAGDHYKWRALRTAGVNEQLITGGAEPWDKFLAFAQSVPKFIGNPLYVWTHLELARFFGVHEPLNGANAGRVWDDCNAMLQTSDFQPRGLLQRMRVAMVGTTDDPLSDLSAHRQLADGDFTTLVRPSFRPDRAFKIERPDFKQYIDALGELTQIDITRFHELLEALHLRLTYFGAHDCTLADHGLDRVRFAPDPGEEVLDGILRTRLHGGGLTELEIAQFATAVNVWLGRQYAARGWVMQLHMGAQRDNNSRALAALGPNTGFDSIGDVPLAEPLARLLDAMDAADELPRTILYGINPGDNEVLATMAGNFQDGSRPGKIQFGSAWWFNDQRDGMERQLTQLSQMGLISQFVGMLTDSRSFLSYPRHEYFRRILCEKVASWVRAGEAPRDLDLLSELVANVCFHNANRYFELDLKL